MYDFFNNEIDDKLLVKTELEKRFENQRRLNARNRVNGKSYKTRKSKSVNAKVVLTNPCSNMKCQNKCGQLMTSFGKKYLITIMLYLLLNRKTFWYHAW